MTVQQPKWLRFFHLTRREYLADFFITPTMTVVYAAWSISKGFDFRWMVFLFAGWCFWTFYEYVLHRWILHNVPVMKRVHWLHHKNQKDYIAVHPLGTFASYVFFFLIFGLHSGAFTVGFSCGYIYFSAIHALCHYGHIPNDSLFYDLKRRHVLHHRHHNVNYGFTTGIWDRALGTEASDNDGF